MIEFTTPEGRIVAGHPMEAHPVTDDANRPKVAADGTPRTSTYVGLAIPKGPETDWKQTPWGQQIAAVALADWPNGEHGSPSFAWKVTDGDSAVPNKRGKKPCDREGWPGHWIIHASTELSVRCHHKDKYEAHEVIQNKAEIKRGDYGRLVLQVKGNAPAQSPGLYVNPILFSLDRPGVEIVSVDATSAKDAFGGGGTPAPAAGPSTPPAVQPVPAFTATPPVQPIPPAQPPERTMTAKANGATYDAMIAAGWTDELLIQHGMMLP